MINIEIVKNNGGYVRKNFRQKDNGNHLSDLHGPARAAVGRVYSELPDHEKYFRICTDQLRRLYPVFHCDHHPARDRTEKIQTLYPALSSGRTVRVCGAVPFGQPDPDGKHGHGGRNAPQRRDRYFSSRGGRIFYRGGRVFSRVYPVLPPRGQKGQEDLCMGRLFTDFFVCEHCRRTFERSVFLPFPYPADGRNRGIERTFIPYGGIPARRDRFLHRRLDHGALAQCGQVQDTQFQRPGTREIGSAVKGQQDPLHGHRKH